MPSEWGQFLKEKNLLLWEQIILEIDHLASSRVAIYIFFLGVEGGGPKIISGQGLEASLHAIEMTKLVFCFTEHFTCSYYSQGIIISAK